MPVKTILQLNVEIAPAPDDAATVKVAVVDAPAAKLDSVGDQLTVNTLPALAGLQVLAVMLKVSSTFPVFLT